MADKDIIYSDNKYATIKSWLMIGLLATPIRIIYGWVLFSSFWRNIFHHSSQREIDITGSVLVGLFGLMLMIGLFSRLSGLAVTIISLGVTMGATWLTDVSYNQWQIGVLGIAIGFTTFLSGGGSWSLDSKWQEKWPHLRNNIFIRFLSSGPFFLSNDYNKLRILTGIITVLVIGWTLINQALFGSVWTKVNINEKNPHLTIYNQTMDRAGNLEITLFEDAGPLNHQAHIVLIHIKDNHDKILYSFPAEDLSSLQPENVRNHYLTKVHTGKFSLIAPLGSEATIKLNPSSPLKLLSGEYQIEIYTIDGLHWSVPVFVR